MKIKQFFFAALLLVLPFVSFAADRYVATSNLNVRVEPGTTHAVSFVLKKGDTVEVLSKHGDWYRIKSAEGEGFAHSDFLKISKSESGMLSTILTILLLIGFIWVLPILVILGSNKTTCSEKFGWIAAILFISWFAWIFYAIFGPVNKSRMRRNAYRNRYSSPDTDDYYGNDYGHRPYGYGRDYPGYDKDDDFM